MIFQRKAFVMLCGAAALAAALHGAAFAQQQPVNPRIALVIGEAAYPDQPLATTANDAGLIAQTLQAAGFDVVGARDLDEKSLRQAFRDFLDKASAAGPDGVDFVYLSGRALQYAGDNYFVPVDAQLARDVDIPIETVKIADFAHALAAISGRSHIVVVDGARANNFAQGTPLAPGLALVDAEPGELIAYNAAPGTVAPDEQGPYGVYGKDLAGALRQGGVPIDDVFAQTRLQVNQDTQGAVVPWSASNLSAPVYIFERAADTPPPRVIAATRTLETRPLRSLGAEEAYAAALSRDTLQAYEDYLAAYPNSREARRVRAILAARREAAFWRHCVRENSPRDYWTYLKRYPNGPHVADASRRFALLSAPEAPPADFEPVEFADVPPPPPDEEFYEERPVAYFGGDDFGPPPPPPPPDFAPDYGEDWRDLPPPPPPQEYGYLPVLPIAIPLIAGAVAIDYLHHERHERRRGEERNGVAPPGQPGAPRPGQAAQAGQAPAPKPAAPPPLPKGVTVKAPPPPQQNAPKPLIPGTPGARPVSTAPAAIKASPPAAPAPAPAGAPAAPQHQPSAPAGQASPKPPAPASGHAPPPQPPAGQTQQQPATPAPAPAGGHALPQIQAPAGHALPQPAPPSPAPAGGHAAPQTQAPVGHAPPQPAPPSPAPAGGHPAPQTQAPVGHAPPQPAPPSPAPAGGHRAPQTQAPAGHALPQPTPPSPAPAGGPPAPQTQAPVGHAPPQPAHAAPQPHAPAEHVAPQPTEPPKPAGGHLAPERKPATPPAAHIAPPPAPHLAPPPAAPAPTPHPAAPPVTHAAPPPAPHPAAPPPAAHAAPPPAPHPAAPPAAHAKPACGGKSEPPCPK